MRAVVTMVALATSVALAGPEWGEGSDAGPLPGSAQHVVGGGGPLTKIIGDLHGPGSLPDSGIGDYQDMYLINICDPLMFRATTLATFDGFANFDASLWLFNADGTGLIANLDATSGIPDPFMLNEATDGTGAMVLTPGLYYLAISGAGSNPLGGAGLAPMFDFAFPGEVSGPDGPGGLAPINGWTNPGEYGHYEIALQGVCTIVPAPGALGCVLSAGLLALRRRR